ncbi:MAG: xanthine dehydrogenase small subunit [Proteobacteria bacterium TMED261]|nr:MAG: xanthine dehydrogenase small subunit [Proteobacteria bacterium TMED261]|tara:strand:- start:1219 stop:2652 length:1434 start_codon:yes stop_codon:yes gene_type:complete
MNSNFITYIRNDRIVEIKNSDSNETLLNYIREKLKKTGSKEGCAEGGCGACTVVIGELKGNEISYSAINSCITFLPTLQGKQLILVEDLISKDGELHPVQEAMVNYHGSQCGFCTPGFIMALFSMYKKYSEFSENVIKDSISGNLCRCTGYQPIINAAKSLKNKNDYFSANKQNTINLLKKINNKSIEIHKNDKKYFAPKSIQELKKILKKNSDAIFLSGGTDLSLSVTKERKEISSIIYMNSVRDLTYIKNNNQYIEVGASTPLIDLEDYIKKYYPDFTKILKRYGSPQIRNVGTVAGNIATASPIGDCLPLLLSLNAQVVLQDTKKTKILNLDNFFISYRKTHLKKGQFIQAVRIPLFKNSIFKAYKISKRFDDDISSVCAAFNLELVKNKVKSIRIAYGGMAAVPKRAISCEKVFLNSFFTEDILRKGKEALTKDFKPISDMRASGLYRMEVAKNLLEKCFAEIKENKSIGVYG